MKIKYILSAMLLSAVVSGVNAQETYSLSDCERMAIENNRKLQNAKLSVEARARLARRFLPAISPKFPLRAHGSMPITDWHVPIYRPEGCCLPKWVRCCHPNYWVRYRLPYPSLCSKTGLWAALPLRCRCLQAEES